MVIEGPVREAGLGMEDHGINCWRLCFSWLCSLCVCVPLSCSVCLSACGLRVCLSSSLSLSSSVSLSPPSPLWLSLSLSPLYLPLSLSLSLFKSGHVFCPYSFRNKLANLCLVLKVVKDLALCERRSLSGKPLRLLAAVLGLICPLLDSIRMVKLRNSDTSQGWKGAGDQIVYS